MLSASHRLGYKDKKTGRVEKLPLSTMDYDPEVEGTKMFLDGYEMYVWKYSVSRCNWGKMKPWVPSETDSKKKMNHTVEDGSGNVRGIKDLSKEERKILLDMLGAKEQAREISKVLRMDYLGVLDIGYRYRAGKLKK